MAAKKGNGPNAANDRPAKTHKKDAADFLATGARQASARATFRTIPCARAIGQIQKAITGSTAVWLPGAEEAQERLPVAQNDLSFQSFLKALGDSTEVKDGGCYGTL